jgi:acyl-CoA thioesterase FadM
MDPMGVDGTVNVVKDHMTVSMYFPVSMREASNLSKTVNYANFVLWYGRLREIAFQPLSEAMLAEFSSMQWGMVTNSTETRIFGEATFGDIVEALFWAARVSASTIDTFAYWRVRLADGHYRPLALTHQASTWVAIVGHGQVEPRPLPDYLISFLDKIKAGDVLSRGGTSVEAIEALFDEAVLGRRVQLAEVSPGNPGQLVASHIFDTDQTDSNVVGNIYFANYTQWQAKLVDRLVHQWRSGFAVNRPGELRGRLVDVSHLREAMPFDSIEVKVFLIEVLERGLSLKFEFFKVQPNSGREKLAVGSYLGAWYEWQIDTGEWKCSSLPEAVASALRPAQSVKGQLGAI